jgi:hypothetical protein
VEVKKNESAVWTKLWDVPDVTDGSIAHGDCRNYAWDAEGGRLVLVSDGGIFARVEPRKQGQQVKPNESCVTHTLLSSTLCAFFASALSAFFFSLCLLLVQLHFTQCLRSTLVRLSTHCSSIVTRRDLDLTLSCDSLLHSISLGMRWI